MDDSESYGLEATYFQEKDQAIALINAAIVAKSESDFLAAFTALSKILNVYQEQSQLLGPHLVDLLGPLNSSLLTFAATNESLEANCVQFHFVCKVIQLICRVRGHKHVLKHFPHEVCHVEQCWEAILAQNSNDYENWESRYVLFLWMSVLCLIPFDISSIDSGLKDVGKANAASVIVVKIVDVCKSYLSDPGPTREAASLCLSSLLTRPDMEATVLHDFLMWSATTLIRPEHSTGSLAFATIGVLNCLVHIFKSGHRSKLLVYAPVILVPCAALNEVPNETLIRKLLCKQFQRIALTFMPPKIAEWRYTRGNRTMNISLKDPAAATVPTAEVTTESISDDAVVVPVELESILGMLLDFLCDNDTVVRWSAAKGIGRIAMVLPKPYAVDVVQAVLELFEDGDADSNWHGGCLALAELSRRGLLPPEHLVDAVPFVVRAIVYDVLRGQHSVGSHVRDAACYVCWSFSRAYSPEIMRDFTESLSESMLNTALFDREVSCRRAACAAFQENVGRQGSENYPCGMDIIAIADYFSVGNRTNSYLHIAPVVAAMSPAINSNLLTHLCKVKIYHWDSAIRTVASKSVALLFAIKPDSFLPLLEEIVANCLSSKFNVRHGALLTSAEIVLVLSERGYALPSTLLEGITSTVSKLEKARLYRGKGGEVVRQAVCYLMECIARSCLEIGPTLQRGFVDSLNEHLMQPFEVLQKSAAAALRQVLFVYFPKKIAEQEKLRKTTLFKYINELNVTDNVAVARGCALALGALPTNLYVHSGLLDQIFDCLESASSSTKAISGEYDAATGMNALNSVIEIVEKVAESHSFSADQVSRVFGIFRKACGNYNIDKRGDVGSWSRVAGLTGLDRLVAVVLVKEQYSSPLVNVERQRIAEGDRLFTSFGVATVKRASHLTSVTRVSVEFAPRSMGYEAFQAAAQSDQADRNILVNGNIWCRKPVGHDAPINSVINGETVDVALCLVLKQLSEKLDTVRTVAGSVLLNFFSAVGDRLSSYDRVLIGDALSATATLAGSATADVRCINWVLPGQVYSFVARLLLSKSLFGPVFSGLVVSIGGMGEAITRVSTDQLVEFCHDHSDYLDLLRKTILSMFADNQGTERVIVPLLSCIQMLLRKGILIDQGEACVDFNRRLVKVVLRELRESSNVGKLCSCLDILGFLLQLDTGIARYCSLKGLVHYVGHKFSRVRKHCADVLYVQLLSDSNLTGSSYTSRSSTFGIFENASDADNAMACLVTTPWDLEDKNVVGSGKTTLKQLCRVNEEAFSEAGDVEFVAKLFPVGKAKTGARKAQKADELDSYEALVREAGY